MGIGDASQQVQHKEVGVEAVHHGQVCQGFKTPHCFFTGWVMVGCRAGVALGMLRACREWAKTGVHMHIIIKGKTD